MGLLAILLSVTVVGCCPMKGLTADGKPCPYATGAQRTSTKADGTPASRSDVRFTHDGQRYRTDNTALPTLNEPLAVRAILGGQFVLLDDMSVWTSANPRYAPARKQLVLDTLALREGQGGLSAHRAGSDAYVLRSPPAVDARVTYVGRAVPIR